MPLFLPIKGGKKYGTRMKVSIFLSYSVVTTAGLWGVYYLVHFDRRAQEIASVPKASLNMNQFIGGGQCIQIVTGEIKLVYD